MQKFFALVLFAGVPALVLFLILSLLGVHWIFSSIVGIGVLGFGLDVCLRGKS